VVAWEGKIGVPYALLRRLIGRRSPRFVILSFTPGEISPLFYPLVRSALKAVEHISVLSQAESSTYQSLFGFPKSRISHCALGAYDALKEAREHASAAALPSMPYVHASGRSARDYATLARAARGLPVKVILHARGYNFRGLAAPANVEIGDFVPRAEYYPLVLNSLFEVVPLEDTFLPVGLSQLVFSMMLGKAVVATRTAPFGDYIQEGVTGVLVEPNNVAAMRAALVRLLENPEETRQMGSSARQRFENEYSFVKFAHRVHSILLRVAAS
jgi:glycosyltransferase involved in cell wall biosynthesis